MDRLSLVKEFINSYNNGNFNDFLPVIEERKPYGLGFGSLYHSIHCNNKMVSFYGKNVLEMGGALPSEYVFEILQPKNWTAVEYQGYDDNQFQSSFLQKNLDYSYYDRGWKSFYESWKNNDQEKFDIVYSIAAFEHIQNLGECIDAIYDMLNVGGKLYTSFMPIWSAPNGSHGFFPKLIGSGKSHEHLLYDFVSLQDLLINTHKISPNLAYKYAHDVYKSDQINRYTYEEYIHIFKHSRFKSKIIYPANLKTIQELYDPGKCLKISARYPGMINSCDGFVLLFTKN